jgi:hypothetical protein
MTSTRVGGLAVALKTEGMRGRRPLDGDGEVPNGWNRTQAPIGRLPGRLVALERGSLGQPTRGVITRLRVTVANHPASLV